MKLINLYSNQETFSKLLLELKNLPLNESGIGSAISIEREHPKAERYFVLGDSHNKTTYESFKTFAKNNPGAGMLLFDAHPDLEKGDFLRKLVDEKIIDKNKIILLGIRKFSGAEKDFMDLNGIRYFTIRQLGQNAEDICTALMETSSKWPSVYLSIDIDVLDPAFAPGTKVIEPAGMSSRELLYFLQRIRMMKNLKAADLVEIDSFKDINSMTVKLGAKILRELV